jgi:hypothetical protein
MSTPHQEIAAATRHFVQSVASQLDAKNLELLEDFIENREYAIAVEWLYSIIKERSIALSSEQKTQLSELATSLDVDLNSVV